MEGLFISNNDEKVRIYGKSFTAESKDGIEFTKLSKTLKIPQGFADGKIVPDFKFEGKNVAYFDGDEIELGLFKTKRSIKKFKTGIKGRNLKVDFVQKTNQGIFLIYHTYDKVHLQDSPYASDEDQLIIKAVCFDESDPEKKIWATNNNIWSEPELWKGKIARCFGFAFFKGKLISYWNIEDLGMHLISFPVFLEHPAHEHHHYKVNKHPDNPILRPNPENNWENEATFNPAAFYDEGGADGGKVYLLYRALGYGYLSVVGLATSTDGFKFERASPTPVYTAREDFEKPSPNSTMEVAKTISSGGGWAGCEDPKVTIIGDRLYMIYVAFNGWDSIRLALTSISLKDFKNQNYLWEKPILISPPGIIEKSGCIFPEKINGKYVIMHRVFPDILIDFVDNLDFGEDNYLKGEFKIMPRPTMWDSRKIAVGAPPIKTDDGWLLIYQAVADNDSSKYKVGAMILDLNDPTKVLYRSAHPFIEPDQYYENDLAKFGIVYPCGAVIIKDRLLIYYGGSDCVTCVASANLGEFLKELKSGEEIKLELPND